MSNSEARQGSAAPPRRPLVSVCIPVYNCQRHIREAVESVLSQSFQDLELVVCDDCSKDDTLSIVQSYTDPRIRLVANEANLGVVGNWNKAMSLGGGKYLKLLCADDFLYAGCLGRQVEVLEDPRYQDVQMVFCRRDIVGPDSKRIVTRGYSGRPGRRPGMSMLRRSVRSGTNIIGEPGSVLFRAEALPRVGGFSKTIPWMLDLDFWGRIMALGDVYAIKEPLCAFRVAKGSWSVDVAKSHAKDFCAYIAALRADPRFKVTLLDQMIGSGMAHANCRLRQVFYRYFLR